MPKASYRTCFLSSRSLDLRSLVSIATEPSINVSPSEATYFPRKLSSQPVPSARPPAYVKLPGTCRLGPEGRRSRHTTTTRGRGLRSRTASARRTCSRRAPSPLIAGSMVPGSGDGAATGANSNEITGGVVGSGQIQPHATEYTLQGVMRFLQTEWHRHERDRNSWEIERLEMRARIATLEGQARRSDATQKALKRYVAILQNKVREQIVHLQNGSLPADKESRAALWKERSADTENAAVQVAVLKRTERLLSESLDPDIAEDEAQRLELRQFLEHCQDEFMYLMVTPANPLPPRESPPLPRVEDLRHGDANIAAGQSPMERDVRVHQHNVQEVSQRPVLNPHHGQNASLSTSGSIGHADRPNEAPIPMVRSVNEHSQSAYSTMVWAPHEGSHYVDDDLMRQNNAYGRLDRREGGDEHHKTEPADNEGWDLDFPQPGPPHAQAVNRPDHDVFPIAESMPKSPNRTSSSHRRKGSMSRHRSAEQESSQGNSSQRSEAGGSFGLRFGLRGHLSAVRTVIFSGGGSPAEPEICTGSDDGTVKRFNLPRLDGHLTGTGYDAGPNSDVQASFTHRGHIGAVLSLAAWSPSPNFMTGGRAQGDGWIFSGGQDGMVRVWERGRVDPNVSLPGHKDAVWTLCVLPATVGGVFGPSSAHGSPDRILLVSGSADGTVRVWSVSSPSQMVSQPAGAGASSNVTTNSNNSGYVPSTGANTGVSNDNHINGGGGGGTAAAGGPAWRAASSTGRARGNSMSSGSGFSSSPQPTVASNVPFHHSLIHSIARQDGSTVSPTCITALSSSGDSFVVSYADSAVIVYDTRTGEQIGNMASQETYDETTATSVNTVVATTIGVEKSSPGSSGVDEDASQWASGPTGGGWSMAGSGVEGTIISGHEDRGYIRFYDANSGQCTYNMVAHPAAISSLSLSPDGRELVSAGHDASIRFWSLEKRSCTQELTSHHIVRGEGVCVVVWSQDGRWVVSGGGDGAVQVYCR